MDVRITDGDIAMASNGGVEYIGSLDEAVQRVRFVALTARGRFIYDRDLGVDYDALSAEDCVTADRLDMLLKEAAAPIGGVETEVLSYDANSSIMQIRVTHNGRSAVTEVDISGNI